MRKQQQEFAKRFGDGQSLAKLPPFQGGDTPVLPPPHPSQAVPGNRDDPNAPYLQTTGTQQAQALHSMFVCLARRAINQED